MKIFKLILMMFINQGIDAEPAVKIIIDAAAHPMALWQKTVENPKGKYPLLSKKRKRITLFGQCCGADQRGGPRWFGAFTSVVCATRVCQ